MTLNQLYDDALNSATTWSPISVVTSDQDDFNLWERGAYVYSGSPIPVMTLTTVQSLTCPNGQDPLNVTFSFTTDVNAYGRISDTEETWDTMTSSKAMDTGAGTKTHSHVVSLACGQTISYWASASTEAGDNGAEAVTAEHEVVIGAVQGVDPPISATCYSDASGATQITNLGSGGLTIAIH